MMAKLADMEELLSDIQNSDVAEYMREAYSCYGAGAYRGCIILCYIAVFDDIRAKLKELAKINSDAKDISKDIEKLAENQKTFEDEMVNRLLSKDLLSGKARKKLKIIQDIRNSAAHPSGIHATAEDARMVFADSIRSFLSEPLLKTTHGADRILEDLSDSNLFATLMAADTLQAVEEMIAPLHVETYPYLVTKLIAEVKGGETQREKNAKRMLFGLAMVDDAKLEETLKKRLIVGCASKAHFAMTINLAIASNGSYVDGLTAPQLSRIKKILMDNVARSKTIGFSKSAHATKQLTALVAELGSKQTFILLPDFAEAVIQQFPYSSEILNAAKTESKLAKKLSSVWIERASSSQFDVANSLAGALTTIDNYSAALLDGKSALELLAGCVSAASHGAFDMISLRDESFKSVPNIREMALAYVEKSPDKATNIIEKVAWKTTDEFLKILD